jgi:glycosyltransferase involved in cell wall biosynthesis
MKIAILSYGHFASVFPLVKSLSKQQHEVCLFLMVNGKHFSESICDFNLENLPDGLISQKASLELLDKPIKEYQDEKTSLHLFKYPDLRVKRLKNYRLSYKLSRVLKKEKYDIVHFNGIKFFPFLIAFFLGFKRIIWTIHDPILHSGEEKRGARFLYKLLCQLKIELIQHNNATKDEFIRTYSCLPQKIHYLPYAPLEVFQVYENPGINPEHATIIFFGRISKYKGLEYLIEAVKMLQNSMGKLKLIIAGKGNYPIDLQSLKDNPLFEIHNRYIPNEELVHLIQRSSLVICPYTDATQSGVIMTAYALSKPVVATEVGGLPEVVIDRETGILVPPKNAGALANAITEILSDSNRQIQYRQAISEYYFKGEYSWNFISKQLIEIYKAITYK